MSEYSVWYVPKDQQRFAGRAHEIADAFWELGVFLATSDRRIEKRIAVLKAQG